MATLITCTVCRASMKIPPVAGEQKKVRCTGCGTLIVVTPDPANPGEVSLSFPKRKDKITGLTEAHKRMMLYGAFVAVCMVLTGAFWWSNRSPPTSRAAVEGSVKLDGSPLTNGTIQFDSMDGKASASTTIAQGRFSISAARGPALGTNRITVQPGNGSGSIAPRFHAVDQKTANITLGTNQVDLEYLSK